MIPFRAEADNNNNNNNSSWSSSNCRLLLADGDPWAVEFREAPPRLWKSIPDILTQNFLVFQLKWNDGYAGHGEHYFDYNHGDNGYKAHVHYAPAYSPPKPAYAGSETDEAPRAFS